MNLKKTFTFIFSITLFTKPVLANYLSIGESGEIIPKDNYRLGASLQSLTAGKSGLNVGGYMDMGVNSDSSARLLFAVGSVDFQLGGSYKYIPFPDYENQPAIGVRTAAWVARVSDTSITTFQIAPLISKKVQVPKGELTPYIAVPINMTFTKDTNTTGTQFVVGTEYSHPELENVQFAGEILLNLNKSESGLCLFASIPLDPKKGLKRRNP